MSGGAAPRPETERRPGRHAPAALAIALGGLSLCAAGFWASPHEQLASPLMLILAVCVVASSFVSLDLDGPIFWSGAAIPHVCALALLGPAPAAGITAVEEVSVWAVDRYRLRMFPINLFATAGPNMLAAAVVDMGVSGGAGYYAVVATAAAGAVVLNAVVLTTLVGLFYGEPVIERLLQHRRLVPALAANLGVALGAVALYRSAGMGATAFLLAGVLIFAYVVKRLAVERETADRIAELAVVRGQLVAQLLGAEDRERKALAEALHDEVVQTLVVTRQDLREAATDGALLAPIAQLDAALLQLRQTIRGTHPSVLEHVGLATALTTVAERYADRGDFEVTVDVDSDAGGAADQLLFSACRELLANAARHANPTTVSITVSRGAEGTVARIKDDGSGFDASNIAEWRTDGHIGLQSVRSRIEAVGGSFEVTSSTLGEGTEAVIRLPGSEAGPLTSVSQNQ